MQIYMTNQIKLSISAIKHDDSIPTKSPPPPPKKKKKIMEKTGKGCCLFVCVIPPPSPPPPPPPPWETSELQSAENRPRKTSSWLMNWSRCEYWNGDHTIDWRSSWHRHSWTNGRLSPLLTDHSTKQALDKAATAGWVAQLTRHSTAAALDNTKLIDARML